MYSTVAVTDGETLTVRRLDLMLAANLNPIEPPDALIHRS